jgi:deoxyribodipyrimidine photo-lyase
MMPATKRFQRSLVWFRRDLRSHDHAALFTALKHSQQVFCVFVLDTAILRGLPTDDRRVAFIHQSVLELNQALQALGGNLLVLHGNALTELPACAIKLAVDAVFTNHDYEPQAISRDDQVRQSLSAQQIDYFSFKDQVIFERDEILSATNHPFSVFTAYKNAWMKKISAADGDFFYRAYPVERYAQHLCAAPDASLPDLKTLGFGDAETTHLKLVGGMQAGQALLDDFLTRMADYDSTRNFPAVKGPSYLSVHLRFGTISIRHLVRLAFEALATGSAGSAGSGAQTWLSELIWRDFYCMILSQHPRIAIINDGGQTASFKPAYDAIVWECGASAEVDFAAWCAGMTGYPLVDAAMRQLNQTGYMHNRLRMVVASFLIKDLGINWRRGEAYFAAKLNDFDLAANNGGWQWAASSGCDAQPYFRIFNPITQSEKFDPEGRFIKRYLPQLSALNAQQIHAPWQCPPAASMQAGIVLGENYPQPIIDHASARQRTLQRYAVVRQKAENE